VPAPSESAIVNVLVSIVIGIGVVTAVTALTGYFVAQEFAYIAVDRNQLKARAATGDAGATRALGITGRTSFMLSGAQLGITVTGLVAGYVAEPMIGTGVAELIGVTNLPPGSVAAIGAVIAVLFVTVIQMVFGELVPKNLAIARPMPVARWLARSTRIYLRVLGPIIRIFDHSAALLLRAVGITPVEDVEHAATARDLERIVAASRTSGELSAELSMLLDRCLDFTDATAEHAMVPRTRVTAIEATQDVSTALKIMASGHSRLPVYRRVVDNVVGVVDLRDLLTTDAAQARVRIGRLARPVVMVPAPLRLSEVLTRLREADAELACVVDEYGGLAGVLTVEDIAEELVGEIADEHDADPAEKPRLLAERMWTVPGSLGVDEVERLIGHDLPAGNYESIGGLIIERLGRFPEPGEGAVIHLPAPLDASDEPGWSVSLSVESVDRRVPQTVQVTVSPTVDDVASTPAGNPQEALDE
jgi:CBS domain containing-hemolysin-like protein